MRDVINCHYQARQQFQAFHARKQRWACIVAHRRAGKTVATIADLQDAALRSTKLRPRYAYIAPFLKQAKTVAWDYLRAGAAPLVAAGLAAINESELRVDYATNQAQVRLYGADNADGLRGIYLDGVVLDEFADFDPRVWAEVIRPALSDRKGWATFIGTPKGRNEFFELSRRAQSEPDWYHLELKASITGLIDREELDDARRQLTPEQYAQEFECSFDAAVIGSYYGRLIAQAERDGRVCGVPVEPTVPVWTSWDLGIRDATAIWWCQVVGKEIHLIDYYEASGADLGHYVREIKQRASNYDYDGHIVPHDAQARELGTGKTRLEVLDSIGLRNLRIAPQHRVEDGINAVRVLLPKVWIDRAKCARGIDALKLYRAEYDDKLRAAAAAPGA